MALLASAGRGARLPRLGPDAARIGVVRGGAAELVGAAGSLAGVGLAAVRGGGVLLRVPGIGTLVGALAVRGDSGGRVLLAALGRLTAAIRVLRAGVLLAVARLFLAAGLPRTRAIGAGLVRLRLLGPAKAGAARIRAQRTAGLRVEAGFGGRCLRGPGLLR